jgi:dihydroorotase
MLSTTAAIASKAFAGAIVMPNLQPPIDTLAAAKAYRDRILARSLGDFEPFIALFLCDKTAAAIEESAKNGDRLLAIKLYPRGVTTNSDLGTRNLSEYDRLFETLADHSVALLVHGETDGFALDREARFAPIFKRLASDHPKLKIVMEHISTAALADLIDKYDNLYATITLHHLLFTLDDLLGDGLNPHLFCKPIVKRASDRSRLRELAFSAHPKVMFGSDSAPHLRSKKECANGAAGIFSAPVLLPKLAELFAENGALENLQRFVSDNARRIHKIDLPRKTIALVSEARRAPDEIDGIVPMCGAIGWSVEGD